jgi:uncharacterized protein YgbK (DUF1537 family)
VTALLIIADDLTGAADTGARFAGCGIATRLLMDWRQDFSTFADSVVVVNTDTRHSPPEAAADRVRQFVAAASQAGIPALYKKVDSTLRGNVGVELDAVLDMCPEAAMVFAPALPPAGRTVRDGIMHVDGVPLAASHVAGDPLHPIRNSEVQAVLGAQHPVVQVSLDQLRGSCDIEWTPGGIHVCDAETDADLAALAGHCRQTGVPLCYAGSAGLAGHLIEGLGLEMQAPPIPAVPKPILAINGSMTPVSLEQVRRGLAGGYGGVRMTAADVLGDDPVAASAIAAARQAGARDESLLLYTAADGAELDSYMHEAQSAGMSTEVFFQRLTVRRTAWTEAMLWAGQFPTLALFGGLTTEAVLHCLGITDALIKAEIDVGVGVLEVEVAGRTICLVTKSGGLGRADLLEYLLQC